MAINTSSECGTAIEPITRRHKVSKGREGIKLLCSTGRWGGPIRSGEAAI